MDKKTYFNLVLSLIFIVSGIFCLGSKIYTSILEVKAQETKIKLYQKEKDSIKYIQNLIRDFDLRDKEKLDIVNLGIKVMEDKKVEITNNLTLKQRMSEIISEVARQEGFKNKELLLAISNAESGLNPDIRGRVDNNDRGLFQINSYWNSNVSDECAFDPWCSTRWVINEINAGNLWKWNASKHNWQ